MKRVKALSLNIIIVMGVCSETIFAKGLLYSIKKFFINSQSNQSQLNLETIQPHSSINFETIIGLTTQKQLLTHIASGITSNQEQNKPNNKIVVFTGDSRTGKTFLTFGFFNELKKYHPHFRCLTPHAIINHSTIDLFKNSLENLNNAVLVLDESNFYEQSDFKKLMIVKIRFCERNLKNL